MFQIQKESEFKDLRGALQVSSMDRTRPCQLVLLAHEVIAESCQTWIAANVQ
jgi:hypothetical protein